MPYIFGLEDFHIDKIVRWTDSDSSDLEHSNVAFDLNMAVFKSQPPNTFK